MRYNEKMQALTTCNGCGNESKNAGGFCEDCRNPDYPEAERRYPNGN